MMELPDSIKVAGRDVSIVWVEGMEAWGDFNADLLEIRLNEELRGVSAAQTASVACHEIMHACLALSGVGYSLSEGQEESIVRMTESLFIPAIWGVLDELSRHDQSI